MAGNPILTYLPLNGTLAGTDRNGAFTATGSGALRWQPAEGARVNYCVNPQFAVNMSGWQPNGGVGASATRIADGRFSGGFACRVVAPGDQTYRGIVGSPSNTPLNVPAFSVSQITMSFDIIVESGPISNLQVGINGYTADNSYIGTTGTATFSLSAQNVLERKSLTMTLNTSNFYNYAKFVPYVVGGQLASVQFLVSNVVVEFG